MDDEPGSPRARSTPPGDTALVSARVDTALPHRLWLGYLALGLLLVGGYYLVPAHDLGRLLRVAVYCGISASAAVAVLVGIWRNRPRPVLPWALLCAGQAVYAVADTTFYVAHYVLGDTDYPALADLFYLVHYPLAVAGLALLVRRRTPGRDLPGLLDAAVLAVVAGMLSWLYLIGPQARSDAPALVKLASTGYPVMDLALLAVGLRLVFGPGHRPPAFLLLAGNLVAILAADSLYVLQQLDGSYQAGNYLDAVWLAGNLALGAAALHPTMGRLGEPAAPGDTGGGRIRLAALSTAALAAPAVLVVQYLRGELRDVPAIAAACALLFLLTIARLAVLLVDQRRLAITDALTGLHTRRFFEAQLPLELARARRAGSGAAVFIIDVDRFKSINDRYGHPSGDLVLVEIAARLRGAARTGDVLARYGGEEFALLVPGCPAEELTGIAERLRQRVAMQPITICPEAQVVVTVSVGTACYPLHAEEPEALVAAADRALYAAKATGRDRIVVGGGPGLPVEADGRPAVIPDYLFRVADEVDALLSSSEHSRAIGRWSVLLATEFGREPASVRCAELAGRLHDIGKVVVPESVLTKPGALTEAEWELIRQHPDHGYRMARLVPGFETVACAIRQHHERWDGLGYPDHLVGRDIRVEARILAVCDSWAAMCADRPYQRALSVEQALAELLRGRGTQFDPEVVDAFTALLHRGLIDDLRPLPGTPRVDPDPVA